MLFQLDALMEAFTLVFSLKTLLWAAVGITVGVGVGAIPGLSASTGVALMLPLAFHMQIASALGLLIGIYKGAEFGGSISAVTLMSITAGRLPSPITWATRSGCPPYMS